MKASNSWKGLTQNDRSWGQLGTGKFCKAEAEAD